MNDNIRTEVAQVPSYVGSPNTVRTASVLDQHKEANWMTQARMRRATGTTENVWFYRDPVPDERALPEVILPLERWQALGEPDTITVVIERGDQLNGPDRWSLLWADDEAVVEIWDTP